MLCSHNGRENILTVTEEAADNNYFTRKQIYYIKCVGTKWIEVKYRKIISLGTKYLQYVCHSMETLVVENHLLFEKQMTV